MTKNHHRLDAFFELVRLVQLDVDREIRSAYAGESAGNLLCALALLAYTEVLGGIKRNTMASGQGAKNFNSFFADLGPEYKRVERKLEKSGTGVYTVFRCGLAHEGFFKPDGGPVAMTGGSAKCGLVQNPSTGGYVFVVERYYKDFKAASDKLKAKKLAQTRPRFPAELIGRF